MNLAFYIGSGIAILSTAIAITRLNAIHALLYVILSLLSVALVFFTLGAPFIAALEVIIYAGAIMVLFVFVVMMLNLGPHATEMEQQWYNPGTWVVPALFAAVLLAELIYVLTTSQHGMTAGIIIEPEQVGKVLFGQYLLGVELASFLLLAGLAGAYHIGRRS